jgi:hypothetical protein
MAESRGGKEDRRLKAAYERLWEQGTDFVPPDQFQRALTSKQLKMKTKANNIAGNLPTSSPIPAVTRFCGN